jgi:metallophosphoesterase (TIGR03767 family)
VRSPARAVLTTERRLAAGPAVRTGTQAAYHSIAEVGGEPHTVRTELIDSSSADVVQQGDVIACIAHITDLHVTDAQSPARFEFINREWQDPRFRELLTMQRPHEMMNTRAVDAMVRTINRVDRGPLTGSPLQLVAMTGDGIDNTQRNELTNLLALMGGGFVRPDSGARGYEGVQLVSWPGEFCWKPDGPEDGDRFQGLLGFPRHPGLLERAIEGFHAEGLAVPWLGCYGNHEEVCQGVGIVTSALAEAMTGSRKPIELPTSSDRDHALETFISHPEQFMSGSWLHVTRDPERRPISRAEFVDAHLRAGGHGFKPGNADEGVAYYAHDAGALRFITLDTVCDAGGADGSIDGSQLHWLERRLEEVHSSFRSRDGSLVRTRNADRIVVILSHHSFDTLANPRGERRSEELLDLLLRFGNVVLWLNGHIHANRVTPRRSPRTGRGFWEVTTSALVDWPCQARLVEIFDAGPGLLAIACTMLDHDGLDLAGLHRELAANTPFYGFASGRHGSPADRNVILLLPSPM